MQFNLSRYENWYNQAYKTYLSIDNDLTNGDFNWACFKSQQAAEFGLKAILYGLRVNTFGHSIKELSKKIENSESNFQIELDCSVFLDKMYIPTRYADAFPDGAPYDFYTIGDAQKAQECAKKNIRTCSCIEIYNNFA
jgi:HEPN domain-containing protein